MQRYLIMHRYVLAAFAVLVGTSMALAGCTSSGSAPGGTGATTGSPGETLAGTATTAPTSSVVTSCKSSSLKLTYRRRFVLVSGEQYGLPPHSKATIGKKLPIVTTLHASAPGLGRHSGLVTALNKHWRTEVFTLGTSSTPASENSTTGLSNEHGDKNVVYALYEFTHEFFGTFSASCGGQTVAGGYRTFGPFTSVVVGCADKIAGRLDRIGHRQFCR